MTSASIDNNFPADNSTGELFLHHSGYDFEFVTPLDKKYECSICLLGLRTPVQTPCGHRFCYECIISSMSRCGELCPFDKNPLNESQLFRDHCVEREILQLKVHCPNYKLGCKAQVDLQYVYDHQYACTYKLIMCPNECSAMILQRELEDHVTLHCLHRLVICQHCSTAYSFVDEQHHLVSCAKVDVVCDLCQVTVARDALPQHKNDVCPRAEITCTFVEHGCQYKGLRDCLKKHMEGSMEFHIQLLSSAYKRMKVMVSELIRNIPFSRQPSFRSQFSTSSIPEMGHIQSDRTLSASIIGAFGPIDTEDTLEKHVWDFDDEVRESQSNILNCDQPEKDASPIDAKKKNDLNLNLKSPKNSESLLRDLSDKVIDINQSILEQTIRNDNLARKINSIETDIQQSFKEICGRLCNGFYIWKMSHFSHLCDLMQRGKVVYSPPFYTSYFGYKFCLRTNVNKTDCGEDFLTLYIHMMQGDFDDILEWPFRGKITISLLDCSSDFPKNDIAEIMEVTTDMSAFLKPQATRSIKGYGYKEFIPMAHIIKPNSGLFIKGDAVYIKATVSPASSSSFEDPSSKIPPSSNL